MLDLISRLHDRLAMTILMVTHHPDDARVLADGVLFLQEGGVEAFGSVEKFFSEFGPAAFRDYIGG
jgi:thiamine transport system ATP-binding protein